MSEISETWEFDLMTTDDAVAETRRFVDVRGADALRHAPMSSPGAADSLYEANAKCLLDLSLAVRRATRSEEFANREAAMNRIRVVPR